MARREESVKDALDLLDWRRRVFGLYADVLADPEPRRAWARWRSVREELFRGHPLSPRPGFDALDHFPYDPAMRFLGEVVAAEPERRAIGSSAVDGRLVLDFNFACHPSCAYDRKRACPLAPPENRLPVPIRAGERLSGARARA